MFVRKSKSYLKNRFEVMLWLLFQLTASAWVNTSKWSDPYPFNLPGTEWSGRFTRANTLNPPMTAEPNSYLYSRDTSRSPTGVKEALFPCKIWDFNAGDYQECRPLGCNAVWVLGLFYQDPHHPTSQKTAFFNIFSHHLPWIQSVRSQKQS
jgi:hypothetical protein